jgi:MATE family multidrug resistance protein
MAQLYQSVKQLAKLALPIIATQFSQMAMGVVDTVMSGNYSTEDLAAVAIGTSVWLPLFLFMAGVLTAITPTIAFLSGEKSFIKIGHTIRQSLWIALFLSISTFLLLQNISPLLGLINVQLEIFPIIVDYLEAISWGMPGIAFFLVIRYQNEGMANTVSIMFVGMTGLAINVIINYMLIFGHFGFPAMGGIGAGWATTITHWIMTFILISYIYISPFFKSINLFKFDIKPQFQEIVLLIKLGLPIGIAFFVEGSIFSVIALAIASLGTIIVAAQQIALNLSSLLFMFPLSISMAITILVGQYSGAKKSREMIQIIKVGYLINIGMAILIASFILFNSRFIVSLYTSNSQVINLASNLLFFAALYQLSDGVQLCSGGALRGLKDTAIPMMFSVFSFWVIGFPLGYTLGMSNFIVESMGAKGFWIGLITGLTSSAILLTTRLYFKIKKLS